MALQHMHDERPSQSSGRRVIRTPSGRIAAEYEPISDKRRIVLGQHLAKVVDGEVRFDAGSRALYATDASNYRQVPLGVVLPRSIESIPKAIATCREFSAAVVLRGGGTS
ncbi:MAG: FAD-binding oxidoreductase, partial [Methylocapsa sp.]|nr:FAD-binding oxidoreductase [Methylocapsa sp.]